MANANLADELVEFRHRLHMIPEPAGEEIETGKLIRDKLCEIGITPYPPMLGIDVVADISGTAGDGPCVALRADIVVGWTLDASKELA